MSEQEKQEEPWTFAANRSRQIPHGARSDTGREAPLARGHGGRSAPRALKNTFGNGKNVDGHPRCTVGLVFYTNGPARRYFHGLEIPRWLPACTLGPASCTSSQHFRADGAAHRARAGSRVHRAGRRVHFESPETYFSARSVQTTPPATLLAAPASTPGSPRVHSESRDAHAVLPLTHSGAHFTRKERRNLAAPFRGGTMRKKVLLLVLTLTSLAALAGTWRHQLA
jgi:hypothetical protein